jgi:hypothetical protein
MPDRARASVRVTIRTAARQFNPVPAPEFLLRA